MAPAGMTEGFPLALLRNRELRILQLLPNIL